MKVERWVAYLAMGFAFSSCSLKGPESEPVPAEQMAIKEADWVVKTETLGRVERTTRELRPAKLAFIQKHFQSPRLTPITLPETNGFDLYYATGMSDLEKLAFIHPKVFVSSSSDHGSILGFRLDEKDGAGRDLVAVSIPVALVNGLVPQIPLIGGSTSSGGSVMTLPDRYKIPNVSALAEKVAPKEIQTLPVCPKVFRLIYQGKEYRAQSPFKNLSNCPINQFFRIVFKAPAEDMKKLLEAAAIQDEAVTIITDLAAEFVIPRISTHVKIPVESFQATLKTMTEALQPKDQTNIGRSAYGVEDIEDAVINTIFTILKLNGIEPDYSEGMPRIVSSLIDTFFDGPFKCKTGGICRALSRRVQPLTPIQYQWVVAESLSTPIETQAVAALGAVANSSDFQSKPAWSVLEYSARPKWFGGKAISAVLKECQDLELMKYPLLSGMDANEIPYIQGYCKGLISNASQTLDPEESDGYYPLGSNTTVYPGAWLRIDLEEISEFTTAKTKVDKDGSTIIESEIKDLLATDSGAQRTSCVEGNQVACEKYSMKEIMVRNPNGDPVFSDAPCKKGEDGCVCSSNEHGETCVRKEYQFQTVMDYVCDAKDQFEYCPYYRTQDEVIDYEKEWECQNIKVESKTSFLCFGGCSEKWELRCEAKHIKPITALRQKLNCKEDDPTASAHREIGCRRPQYLCERWSTRCTRYSVNESFMLVHEDVAPKWRPFAIRRGEYPKRFEDQIYLKFVSPKGTAKECRLDQFGRFFRGNTLFIKIPTEKNEDIPCDVPIWNSETSKALYLPKVYIKNDIHYSEMRMCGRTEYSFLTEDVPVSGGKSVIPTDFTKLTKAHIGPVANSCRAPQPIQIGSDLWFSEISPIRIGGRVSVLGRVLESIVTEDHQ
ncbi:MAG: hypothetical protein KGQ59_01255 [Bdellovibrionales bacterium]|nr:hypothetical protein [Bdellovibrionales bacterium]